MLPLIRNYLAAELTAARLWSYVGKSTLPADGGIRRADAVNTKTMPSHEDGALLERSRTQPIGQWMRRTGFSLPRVALFFLL